MYAINKPQIINELLRGLEMAELNYDYANSMRGAIFPSDIDMYRTRIVATAEQIRGECDKIIRGIGGITISYTLQPEFKIPVTILGVTKYHEGNWHFPYREGNQISPAPLERPTGWLREAYGLAPTQQL